MVRGIGTDGLSDADRAKLVAEIGRLIGRAEESIEFSVDHQIISYRYSGSETRCRRHGPGRTLTIKIDGGADGDYIGLVPTGTFPADQIHAESGSVAPEGPRLVDGTDSPVEPVTSEGDGTGEP